MATVRTTGLLLFAIGSLALGSLGAARADITFVDNNGAWENLLHQYGLQKQNVLFNGVSDVTLGDPVIGHTNRSHVLYDVQTTFHGNLQVNNGNGGQAKVSPSNHKSFSDFSIDQTADNPFRALIFYVDTKGNATGTDLLQVNIGTEANPNYVDENVFLGQGENQIGMVSFNNQQISSVTLSGSVPLDDVRQIRVAGPGAQNNLVPEGDAFSLLMCGIGPCLAFLGWRRYRRH